MFKSTAAFDKAMYNILCQIRDGSKLSQLELDIPEDDVIQAIAECVNRCYLEGVSIQRMAGGPVVSDMKARITYSGLKFIESF